ncbi:MAG: hypothetical protein DRR06_19480 [Gammaproteobacteria bacterium]|nr:MAG: hypothetical protein DRR06_19480 [Gammaproteobacteria bacterium]
MSAIFDEWEEFCSRGNALTFKCFVENKVTELEQRLEELQDCSRCDRLEEEVKQLHKLLKKASGHIRSWDPELKIEIHKVLE